MNGTSSNGTALGRWLGTAYAATIFLSAFLLFQVQPLISKTILPWFGGTPAVWTTCMLFFQVVLFAGYAYAHVATQHLSPRRQVVLHTLLLLGALSLVPIVPDPRWKPTGSEEPTLRILLLLATTVGLPFFLLSTTGPLVQGWFSRTHAGRSPYRLYALSNIGSLLALVSYPFVVEPALATRTQAECWSWGFAVFAVLCAACGSVMARSTAAPVPQGAGASRDERSPYTVAPSLSTRALWFGLAMTPSVMLLATTNQVCMDVAAVPFLWVLPLSLYLMTFILCFDSERWYSRRSFALAAIVSMAGVVALLLKGSGGSIVAQVVVYFSGLFFCAMVCHGELVRLKPEPRHLTGFYLTLSAGGAAGGLFAGLLAPALFHGYAELHFALLACTLLMIVVFFVRERAWRLPGTQGRSAFAAMLLYVLAMAGALRVQAVEAIEGATAVSRNFYGVLRVREEDRSDGNRHRMELRHGRIVHGMQFLSPDRRHVPTTYYGPSSGVGRALRSLDPNRPARVGVIGLGVGTLAAYGRPGDTYRFYEINPEVIRLADEHFTFLGDSPATIEHVLGDARLSMEHEPAQGFDVLVLDAFSGDAIPTHLLTVEAFEIYRRHLKSDGVIAVHISNLHFDLRPVVLALADRFGFVHRTIFAEKNEDRGENRSLWMLLAAEPGRLKPEPIGEQTLSPVSRRILWTDDRSDLFQILR